MNPTIIRALEQAAIICLFHGTHDWPAEFESTKTWLTVVEGLKQIGAIGYVKRPKDWVILYELYPDDSDYVGQCGDGRGDRFAVIRSIHTQITLFN